MQRVLGGEVITWVCTPDGGVVDVLPGVMDAETYMEGLREAALFFESVVERVPSAKDNRHDAMAKPFGDRLNADDSYWMGFVYQQRFRNSRMLWGRETPLAEKYRRLTPFPFDSRVEVVHVFSVEISAHETDPTYIEIGHVKPGHFEDPLQESTWVAMNQWRPQVLALMGLEPGASVDVLSPATFRLVFHLNPHRSLSGRIDGFLPVWAQAD
ncbi:MAG: hypothetical protein P1V35_03430 [Planctomycetota bacterium]|nr:hypothetical protein [Planctomycetota bacterium]